MPIVLLLQKPLKQLSSINLRGPWTPLCSKHVNLFTPHKTLGTRYPRCSPDLYRSQEGGISDPLGLLNNNSNGHYIAMNVYRTEGESDHWDLSEDPLVDNLVACMICKVVDETLGFSEAGEPERGPPLEPPQGPPPAPPPPQRGEQE